MAEDGPPRTDHDTEKRKRNTGVELFVLVAIGVTQRAEGYCTILSMDTLRSIADMRIFSNTEQNDCSEGVLLYSFNPEISYCTYLCTQGSTLVKPLTQPLVAKAKANLSLPKRDADQEGILMHHINPVQNPPFPLLETHPGCLGELESAKYPA